LKGNMDYMKWLKAMKAAKYAASSQWIAHVDKMIKRYDLTAFDPTDASDGLLFTGNTDSIPEPRR
jgi:hypothetical protein